MTGRTLLAHAWAVLAALVMAAGAIVRAAETEPPRIVVGLKLDRPRRRLLGGHRHLVAHLQ
jgi:hypothetical protein